MVRKKQQEEHGGESWLMSYCDMITLLVTFFLMMMTFSTSSHGDIKELGVGLLTGRAGAWPSSMGSSYDDEIDRELTELLAEDFERAIEDSDGSMALQSAVDGLVVQFDTQCSFPPSSNTISPKLRENLERVATLIARYDNRLVVEGSTDSEFLPTARFPTAQSMGAARAAAAARILLENPALAPERVQVASFGDERPLAPNDTAVGRKRNRCVDVRVLAGPKARLTNAPEMNAGAK